MAKYVAYIRGVKSQVNNRYFMYAKVYVCTDSTTETHDYQNRSRGNDICTEGPAVCVELLNFIRPNLFEVAKGGYVGSTFICLQCEKAKLLLFTRTIYFAS